MIKHFRKIRLNLLSRGNNGEYLKYALGEIALVVVGILIALSVSNWNEERIEREKAYAQLKQIKNELILDIEHFEYMQIHTDRIVKVFQMAAESGFKNDSILLKLSKYLTINSDPREFGQTYRSMVNSGAFQHIEDEKLIKDIEDYYIRQVRIYNNFSSYHKQFMIHNIEGYLLQNFELNQNGKFDVESIRNGIENGNLSSVINWQLRTFKTVLKLSNESKKRAETLVEAFNELP